QPRVSRFGLLLLGVGLWGCGVGSQGSRFHHTPNRPVRQVLHPWAWVEVTAANEAVFWQHAQGSFGATDQQRLDQNSEAVQLLQNWIDRLDATIRADTDEDLSLVPKPTISIVEEDKPN